MSRKLKKYINLKEKLTNVEIFKTNVTNVKIFKEIVNVKIWEKNLKDL